MPEEKLIEIVFAELKTINAKLNELNDVKHDIGSLKTDVEWLKRGMSKIQREMWAIFSIIIGTAILFWFLTSPRP